MKAIRIHRFGDPTVLSFEDIPRPVTAADDVLVRVLAAGVGPWDALVREGASGLGFTVPLTLGSDVAGYVETVGERVSAFAPGDAVFGATPHFVGGYAEWALAPAAMLSLKPTTRTFVEAAATPIVAVTAWQMLFEYARVERGQTILVQGAAGSVGTCAVQLAHAANARIVATCAAKDVTYVRNLGADVVIDYAGEPFERASGQVDAVIDTVGGDVQARSFSVIRPGGILVSSVSQPDAALATRYRVRGEWFLVDVSTERLEAVASRMDSGILTVEVGATLPLAEAKTAHEMLAGTVPRPRGKIVLRTDD